MTADLESEELSIATLLAGMWCLATVMQKLAKNCSDLRCRNELQTVLKAPFIILILEVS